MTDSLPGDFLRDAVLDTVVPHTSDIDIEDAIGASLQEDVEDSSALLPGIKQRPLLFFDEHVTVYVVLRLSDCSESLLKTQLPRLLITVEAFAASSQNVADGDDENNGAAKDLIFSGAVKETEDPLIVVNEFEDDEGGGSHVFVIWKVNAFLNRPRIRLQQPSVSFIASAALNPSKNKLVDASDEDQYLPTSLPGSQNVFQTLSQDPDLKNSTPYLPASRLLRVVPATHTEEPIYNIQQKEHHPIRIIPAASARIRYSRINTYSGRPTTIASLDFEVTPFANFQVTLQKAQLTLSDGHVEELSNVSGLVPPIQCRPRDNVTLMYKLTPEYGPEPDPPTTAMVSILEISLGAIIQVSSDCHPQVSMMWKTNVDFSTPVNPTFGAPSQVLQRNNRPASLSMAPNHGASSSISNTAPSNRSSLRERAYSTTELGVTISFSGPHSVEIGTPFRWDIFIVNRSGKARKLALVGIPRRKRAEPKKHVPRPSSSSTTSRKEDQVAEAVTDENIVYAMQKNAAPHETELVCLSTDVRVGPLLPGACHSTELKLLALVPGALHLEAVRLVDLNTNETTDIRDLPDIVAFNRQHKPNEEEEGS
ncbi:hypothetical protein FQN54_003915 [Arachnomyces sp. PD_36]|nr:hypothetical protein FQN54_003915 [Arachnomyces sp. PD_36]